MTEGTELRATAIAGPNAWKSFEVFYRNDYMGMIASFGENDGWKYQTPYSMMWWKESDQTSAINRLLENKGIISA